MQYDYLMVINDAIFDILYLPKGIDNLIPLLLHNMLKAADGYLSYDKDPYLQQGLNMFDCDSVQRPMIASNDTTKEKTFTWRNIKTT